MVLGAVVGDHHDERESYQRVRHDGQAKDHAPGLVRSQAFLVLVVRQNAGDAHGDEETQVLREGKHGDAGAAEFKRHILLYEARRDHTLEPSGDPIEQPPKQLHMEVLQHSKCHSKYASHASDEVRPAATPLHYFPARSCT